MSNTGLNFHSQNLILPFSMASNNQIVSGTQFPFQSQNCSVAMIFFNFNKQKKNWKGQNNSTKKNHLKNP